MELLEQFKRYLENEITNTFIEEDERVEFKEVYEVKEDGIELVAVTDVGTFRYYYNCIQDFGETQLYEFYV